MSYNQVPVPACDQCNMPMEMTAGSIPGTQNPWLAYVCQYCNGPTRYVYLDNPTVLSRPSAPVPQRNEFHVCLTNNGHLPSVDCWCEPTNIFWVKNRYGVDVLVVQHCDFTTADRGLVVARREHDRDAVDYTRELGVDCPWITQVLGAVDRKQLPPHMKGA